MPSSFTRTLFGIALLGWSLCAQAAPTESIPEILKPWIPWVLQNEPRSQCLYAFNAAETRECQFPSRLELGANSKGAQFKLTWSSWAAEFVGIPGNTEHWPLDVRVDGKAVAVPGADVPRLWVTPGAHTLSGRFEWNELPESLPVPETTGLVQLSVQGKTVREPNLDGEGNLWLRSESDDRESGEGDNLEVHVFRKLVDEIPFQVETRVDLKVSGRDREVKLGPVLLLGFTPLSVGSPLPAKLEPDGTLRLQVRAGQWTVTLVARSDRQGVSELQPTKPTATWPEEEFWAFEARPGLRVTALEGPPAVDPQQTQIPAEWRNLPCYRLTAEDTLKLATRSRGRTDAIADKLSLARTLWLDFDGRGMSVRDQISGTLLRGWRLEMAPPMELGRAALRGESQLLTTLAEGGPVGFEVRETKLDLQADSRMVRTGFHLPATGWNQNFQSVSATLNLPPGWRALAVTGADRAQGTWLGRWDLAHVFLLLLLSVSVFKLKGLRWGIFTALALVFLLPEASGPKWSWVAMLVLLVLSRVLPTGKIALLTKSAGWILVVAITAQALLFVDKEIRKGVYLALEKPHEGIDVLYAIQNAPSASVSPPQQNFAARNEAPEAPSAAAPSGDDEVSFGEMDSDEGGVMEMRKPAPKKGKARLKEYGRGGGTLGGLFSNQNLGQKVAQFDPNAVVQVGHGIPRWEWNRLSYSWSGPVSAGEQVGIVLAAPWANRLLAFLRAGLALGLLFLLLKEWLGGGWLARFRKLTAPQDRAYVWIVFLLLSVGAPAWAAEIPDEDLLGALKERVTKKPDCLPHCASLARAIVEYSPQSLTLRLEIHSGASVAVPLPGTAKQWLPSQVTVDGKPAALKRDANGTLWAALSSGQHQILLTGALAERDTVSLPMGLPPHNVTARGTGWTLEGIHADGQAEQNLELRRIVTSAKKGAVNWGVGNLPPFVVVEREIALGLTWNVRTRVSRLSPGGSPLVVSIPLLEGESVTSAGVRAEKKVVQVNLGPRDQEKIWDSVLAEKQPIVLKAPEEASWVEVWRVDASPIWNVSFEGTPIIQLEDNTGKKMPQWRPWPSEALTIQVSRPKGAVGKTLTIDSSSLEVRPGSRTTDAKLGFHLRASRGAEHVLKFPAGAELQSVTVDGTAQSLRFEADGDAQKMVLPVVPGSRHVVVEWREPRGIGPWFSTPSVSLGTSSTNVGVEIRPPYDRWVLWTCGPRLGPAVLIWGALVLLTILAYGLKRLGWTPLRGKDWMLLGLGLAPVSLVGFAFLAVFFLALEARSRFAGRWGRGAYNLSQLALFGMAGISAIVLLWALNQGFFGTPVMHIEGNYSSVYELRWFQDRIEDGLPRAGVLSLPLLVYRFAMLGWALWLAFSLIRWARWIWNTYTADGLWKQKAKL